MTSESLLKIHFVALTILGGFLLGGVAGTESLAAIAFSAGVFSLIFVDWLGWFFLPSSIAYGLMAIASVYCIGGFWSGVDDRQIAAVAKLLVMVQAILHLQRKNRRVFEQLGVFAMLELIVAAVLNDALFFGLLLIPFSAIGMSTMVHLQAFVCMQRMASPSRNGIIQPLVDGSLQPYRDRHAGASMLVLGPAVLAFAATFFYALPRSSGGAAGGTRAGNPTTGFTDTVEFSEMGRLLNNPRKVMRVELQDMEDEGRYILRRPAYLRGQVLDSYYWQPEAGLARWVTARQRNFRAQHALPGEYFEETNERRILHDRVKVSVRAEPLNTNTVFAIAPYYDNDTPRVISHWPRRWLLARSSIESYSSRIEYSFVTHGLHNGRQSRWLRYIDQSSESHYGNRMGAFERQLLLTIRDDRLPTLVAEAQRTAEKTREGSDYASDVATALERYFTMNPEYRYTMDLRDDRHFDVDPMEHFVATRKAGHCQYYAGALALMLRSQGIPARMVVGYKTDEYNDFGGYYIVRQLHAHAWVEAYFERHDLRPGVSLVGQAPGGGVWMRLDPTPDGDNAESGGDVSHMMDFAQSLWDDYVLDMSNRRQGGTLKELGQGVGEVSTYRAYMQKMEEFLQRLRDGDLGGGAAATGVLFSWHVAAASIAFCLCVVLVWRNMPPLAQLFENQRKDQQFVQRSEFAFFEKMCDLLSRAGLVRDAAQTPAEFSALAQTQLACNARQSNALERIVRTLYALRFGRQQPSGEQRVTVDKALAEIESLVSNKTGDHV